MNVVPGRTTDLPDIVALLGASGLPTAGIESHINTMIVIRDSNGLAGCAAVEIYGTAGLLRSVAVHRERRGEGLGHMLTQAALDFARGRGVRDVYLLTTTASRFFPRFGFAVISRADLDPALNQSEELRGACPASAIAMRVALSTSSPSSPRSSSSPPAPRG